MRLTLTVTLAVALLGGVLTPGLQAGSGQEAGISAATALEVSETVPSNAPPPQVDSSAGSGVVMLVGFLGLIAGLLAHWSRDTSCRDERSVFRPEETV